MLILHAGNFGARAKGAFIHSVAPKLSRGLIRAGHAVIDFDDREAARAGTPFGARKLGAGSANRALARIALDTRPDVLLLGHADTIRPRTIADIRRAHPQLRVLQWNVDPLFEPDNVRRIRGKIDVVDATLVSTWGESLRLVTRPGMALGFLPNPVDFSIEAGRADLIAELDHDLFYACGHPARPPRVLWGRAWDMEALVGALRAASPGLRARTPGLFGAPTIAGPDYQRALAASALGLNVSRRNDVPLYSSDRLAHMAGNGQAILIDRATDYGTLFGDHEFAFFEDFESLAGQVRTLVAEPARRMALAAAGRARYHALFNERRVAAYVVAVALGTHRAGDEEWPTLLP